MGLAFPTDDTWTFLSLTHRLMTADWQSVGQFGVGQSNPSYVLVDGNGKRYVLRKKPPGKIVSPTAHQVGLIGNEWRERGRRAD